MKTTKASAQIPTVRGPLTITAFIDDNGVEHACIIIGDPGSHETPLCRIHSSCVTGEIFGSLKCDCSQQLNTALDLMQEEGCGILIYLNQEGRGIGLSHKLSAYALQEGGLDTVDANRALGLPDDARDYSTAIIQIKKLNIDSIRLLTNNPDKISAVRSAGILCERIPHFTRVSHMALDYVETKKRRMGHLHDPDSSDMVIFP